MSATDSEKYSIALGQSLRPGLALGDAIMRVGHGGVGRGDVKGANSGKEEGGGWGGWQRTALPAANFFSVPMTEPLRWAALRALFPLMTVSLEEAPPRALEPILVTLSQSSILAVSCVWKVCRLLRWCLSAGYRKDQVLMFFPFGCWCCVGLGGV